MLVYAYMFICMTELAPSRSPRVTALAPSWTSTAALWRLLLASLLLAIAPLMLQAQALPAQAPSAPNATAPNATAPNATALTLRDALREADARAYTNRIAASANDAERARARQPLKGILPSARVEAGVVRTTDPIGAFGTTLRQRLVTPAAFDPARLNNPAAVTNVQGGLVVEVPLINGDAWTGLRAARAAADATSAVGEWTAVNTRVQVVRAYYGAILAGEKVLMLQQAAAAATSAVRQVQSMVQQGMVTKADALQASVRAGDVEAQLLTATMEAETARQQMAVLLGRPDGVAPTLPAHLPDDAPVRALAERDTLRGTDRVAFTNALQDRADVRAARAGLAAADADRQRAMSTLLPRVNGFARYDWNDPTALYSGRRNWTMGVMASWSLFGGGSELADVEGARARATSARAGQEAALAQGQLESDAARRAVTVALQRLDLAQRASEQSREAHRLVQKRYVGGLATIAELLAAESTATASALAHVAARYALIEALATLRSATGGDPADLAVLEGAS